MVGSKDGNDHHNYGCSLVEVAFRAFIESLVPIRPAFAPSPE